MCECSSCEHLKLGMVEAIKVSKFGKLIYHCTQCHSVWSISKKEPTPIKVGVADIGSADMPSYPRSRDPRMKGPQ